MSDNDVIQGENQPGGRVSVHGMIVFGSPESGVYLSHIPMFHPPHDIQAIFRVSLPGTRSFQDGLYTFQPERFSLDDLIAGRLSTIKGTLYSGSFEGDGQSLEDMTIHIDRVLEAVQLYNDAPQAPALEYTVIGTPQDAYLIHSIGKPPSFDQIVRLDLSQSTLTAADIQGSVHLVLSDRSDDVANHLAEGSIEANVAGTDRSVTVTVSKVLSILVGPMFQPSQ
jgi:hypothetical protein